MTIDEAIRILGYAKQQGERQGNGGLIDAAQLGIEALKRLQDLRKERGYSLALRSCYLLPGEE